VQSFFRTHYLPSNAVLTIVGDVDPEDAFERAAVYFGHLPGGTKPGKPQTAPLGPLTSADRGEVSGVVPAEAVYLSWRLPQRGTRHFDAVDLAFSVLGHGQTSRLHKVMVRGTERAEVAGASALGLIGGNSAGLAYARARDGVPVEQLEADLVGEVERLRSDPPTEMELQRAKAQYERHWLHELVRVDSRADALGEYATLHDDPSLINTRVAEINAVTLDDIAEVLPRWFTGEQRATLIYRREAR
jgi:predicted Zn-dependent peptidase